MESHLNGNVLVWSWDGLLGLPFTGSAYRAPDGTVVWLDPPPLGASEREVLALGTPSHILVTFRDHDRAIAEYAPRFGAKVWVPRGQGGEIRPMDVEFDDTTELPAGLRAISMPAVGYGEHALVTEAYGTRFAFIGDAFFNFEGSQFPWLIRKAFFRASGSALQLKRKYRGGDSSAAPGQIRKLLDERLDAVFLSHGRAILEDADAAIRAALGA